MIIASTNFRADLKLYRFVEKAAQQPTKGYTTSFKKGGSIGNQTLVLLINFLHNRTVSLLIPFFKTCDIPYAL